MRYAIAILAANAAIGWYHWSIYRSERMVSVRKPRKEKFVVLVGPQDEALAAAIKAEFGGHVQMWQSNAQSTDQSTEKALDIGKAGSDGVLSWNREKVIGLISQTPSDEVMVLLEKRGPKVIPISRGH